MSSTLQSGRPRARLPLAIVTAVTLAGAAGVMLSASPARAASGCSTLVSGAVTTVTCSVVVQGITVPAGVTSAQVTLDGAAGGPSVSGVPGGKGAHVTATIAVTPGATLGVFAYPRGTPVNGQADAGGFGGGPVAVTDASGTPLVMAGSGGGAGGAGTGLVPFAGTPGGDSASPGTAGSGLPGVAEGGGAGGAGTATAGGAGGAGGAGSAAAGTAGGAGGSGIAPGGTIGIPTVPGGSGGGGGSGYFAGGGGGAAGITAVDGTGFTGGSGGSGGGGFSLVSDTVPGTPSSVTDGVNAGDGTVVIVFTVPAPAITAISPASGPTAGGTSVTITGTNLSVVNSITFGGNAATAVSCTATSCTATAPAGTAGTVDVQATSAGGTSATSPADQYTYVAPPLVTGISPATGTTAGGTTVTITGTGLSGASAVTFGPGNNATGVSCTATACTATAPAESAGTVDVQVTTPGGTSATSSSDQYTYIAPYPFTGFFSPVDNQPTVNMVHAGQSIPIKFSLGSNLGLNIIAAGYPVAQTVNCNTGAPVNTATETDTAGGSGLQYDAASNTYTYVWKTSRASAGTCQTFTLGLTDGTFHSASFEYAS